VENSQRTHKGEFHLIFKVMFTNR